ncbi:GIY-YIG nuclease family protein [Ulvibacterium sp.]|uniref:GIY-YIG nuclease family protein n=1 Tax=Ulvibacterium sp. TaxID=2665914 RepID=UPI003BAA09A2
MAHYVYVIQSLKDDSYYIGRTSNLKKRLKFHNSVELNTGITRLRKPWGYFYTLEVETSSLADKIEKHIKKMKSRKYILNLKKYPEISRKLIEKYS